MSLFAQVAQAQAQSRSAKLDDMPLGESRDYVVRLGDILYKPSNRGGMNYIVEAEVVKGTEGRPAGTQVAWVQQPETRPNTDAGNVKAFVNACLGRDDANAPQTAEEGDASLEGAYKGVLLAVNVKHIKTQAGYDFFVHTWSPFRGDVADAPPPPPAKELTKERWLAGEGPGKKGDHGEYHPQHTDWGWRPVIDDIPF